jgi:hypothetical protein
MTASLKYVRRLIGVVLGLAALVSWLALQTPAQRQTDSRIKLISHGGEHFFHTASDEAVMGLRIAHLGLRNAGLRSAVYSPSQSQSATISNAGPEISTLKSRSLTHGERHQETRKGEGGPPTLVGKKSGEGMGRARRIIVTVGDSDGM